ncbi:MAG TPA: hypothetical protein VKR32_17185 [Puia sp.]|nr:hypothetical protein [Puia sp.]
MADVLYHPASYKDPSGFVFTSNGKIFRQVNKSYREDYDLLLSSGLYKELSEKKFLVTHQEVSENLTQTNEWYKTLSPEHLPFISYPYEWCFDELKDAALLTLKVMKISMKRGMILKDATPFNVQFLHARPIFIDTLSFEKYEISKPWIAYRQFCECFLFPLLLEHYRQIDTQKLLTVYLEGIPAQTTAKLLPRKSLLNINILLHVFLQNSVAATAAPTNSRRITDFNPNKLLRLIDSLESTIRHLRFKTTVRTTWNNYYEETILSQEYLNKKEHIFREYIKDLQGSKAIDIGCNDGFFSKILAEYIPNVIAVDFDSQCINRLYTETKSLLNKNILPLCVDLTNPSPSVGFNHAERESFRERAKSATAIALGLIHHLVLSKNIPISGVAKMFADLTTDTLIIEFVPLNDEKAQLLIANKTKYHVPYDSTTFELVFEKYFAIEKRATIPGTERILYRMRIKS